MNEERLFVFQYSKRTFVQTKLSRLKNWWRIWRKKVPRRYSRNRLDNLSSLGLPECIAG